MQIKKLIPTLTILIVLSNVVYANLIAHYSFDKDDMVNGFITDDSGNGNQGIFDKNTKLLMHFDEGQGGTVSDGSGSGNDGNIFGAGWTNGIIYGAKQVGGRLGNALELDGVDDYVDVGNVPSLDMGTDSFTVEVWGKTSSGGGTYVGKANGQGSGAGYFIGLEGNNPRFNIHDGTSQNYLIPSIIITDNVWHHLIMVVDRTNNKIYAYLDGSQAAQGDITIGSVSNSDNLYIGRLTAGYYNPATIDDVRIYNRALSPEEIQKNKDGDVTRDGLVSEFKFDNIKNSIVYDTARAVSGGALEFDGVDDYVDIPMDTTLLSTFQNHDFTVEGWMYFNDNLPAVMPLFAAGTPGTDLLLHIGRSNDKALFAFYADDLASTGITMSPNVWWHLAATWVASTRERKLYVNGILDASDTSSGALNIPANSNFHIGLEQSLYHYGAIDEVAIHSKALRAEEIQEHYNAKKAKFTDWTTGKVNIGLEFNGIDDKIYVPDSDYWNFGSNDFSISLWAKWLGNGGNMDVIGIGAGQPGYARAVFRYDWSNNYWEPHAYNDANTPIFGDTSATWTPTLNQWYYITFVRNGNNFYYYIDGQPLGTTSDVTGESFPDADIGLTIGAWYNVEYFKGIIDEVKIYNQALTAEQIKGEYDVGMSPPTLSKKKAAGFKPNLISVLIIIFILSLLAVYDLRIKSRKRYS